MPGPRSELIPNVGAAYHGWGMGFSESFIPKTLIPKALSGDYTAENPLTWYSFPDASFPPEQQFLSYQYPIKGANPIHMIWSDSPCWTTCWNGGNSMIEALRSPKIEFIVTQHPWLENDCLFADLLLPVNTKFEEEDISVDVCGGDFNLIFREEQCIESIGESMSDWEICCEVAKRFGPDVYEKYTQGLTVEDYIRLGFENSGVQNYIIMKSLQKISIL
jgi:trimethylamine-N-oxide reductase (cytochrome c)